MLGRREFIHRAAVATALFGIPKARGRFAGLPISSRNSPSTSCQNAYHACRSGSGKLASAGLRTRARAGKKRRCSSTWRGAAASAGPALDNCCASAVTSARGKALHRQRSKDRAVVAKPSPTPPATLAAHLQRSR